MAIVPGQRRNPYKIAGFFGLGALNHPKIKRDTPPTYIAVPAQLKNRERLAWSAAAFLLMGFIGAAWFGGLTHFRRAPERALTTLLAQPMAYQTRTVAPGFQLVWFDRTGKQVGVLGNPALYFDLALSPDGKRASVSVPNRSDPTGTARDIWIYDVARGLRTRFTSDPGEARTSIWSPDGSQIVFASDRNGQGRMDFYQKASNGNGSESTLLEDNVEKFPDSWSPDGKFILYLAVNATTTTGTDLFVLPLSGDRKPYPFLHTRFNETEGQFSPDGRWVAYVSDDSGDSEIYVAPFPGPGAKKQISTDGGTQPRWSHDGKELFFLDPGNALMAAAVNGKGATFEVDAVKQLFQTRAIGRPWEYEVSLDGQQFLITTLPEQPGRTPGTVIARGAELPTLFGRDFGWHR